MSAYLHLLRRGLAGLVVLVCVINPDTPTAQSVAADDAIRSGQRMLECFRTTVSLTTLCFAWTAGPVYLAGFSFEGRLKADAEMAVKRASGVVEVSNKIEVLPASQNDDRIRWETFYRIYTDDFLSRYAPGGVIRSLAGATDERRFPGMRLLPLPNPHHREERSNDAARCRRQCGGPPDCRGPCTGGERRLRGGERIVAARRSGIEDGVAD